MSALAKAAIAAQLLFVGGCLVAGTIEGHGYSPGRDEISDLGAMTAHHPGLFLSALAISGVVTIAFALGPLRSSLAVPARGVAVGAVLTALSLPGLDNTTDALFRLDCRAADSGCSMSAATTSWHGKLHIAVFIVAALATLAAPFVLAQRMRLVEQWRSFAGVCRAYGIAMTVAFVATMATSNSDIAGWTQRALIVFTCTGLVVLAARTPGVGSARPSVTGGRRASAPTR